MFVPILLTKKQRQVDLCIAVIFQAGCLIGVCELELAKYALPVVGVMLGAYIAASLSTIYVLIVSEFKPVLMETVSFTYWILCNILFVVVMCFPPAAQQPTEPEARIRKIQLESRRMELEKVKQSWGQLSPSSREMILDHIDAEFKD